MKMIKVFLIVFFMCIPCFAQQPAAIIVNSTADPGISGDDFVTLREAMLFATGKQSVSGGEIDFVPSDYGIWSNDTILFDSDVFPPDDPQAIFVISEELPHLDTGGDTIDGSNAGVIINGSELKGELMDGMGVVIESSNNRISGIQVINFPTLGIYVHVGSDNVVGGDRTKGQGPLGEGNLMSGNGVAGLSIDGSEQIISRDNLVFGNLIGTDISGTNAFPNNVGIDISPDAHSNIIGATSITSKNVISGNTSHGIQVQGGPQENLIIGNYIGTDITGTKNIGNQNSGIWIWQESHQNIIGGAGKNEENLILWNGECGISLVEVSSIEVIGNIIGYSPIGIDVRGPDNVISENFIGVMSDKNTRIPNQGKGIDINANADRTIIGPSNVIWYNTMGIFIDQSIGNRVSQNSISRNFPLEGIKLNDNGNNNIEPPFISTVVSNQVSGTSSTPDGSIIEIFNDPRNQGETYLGSTTVTNGQFTFTGEIPTRGYITATVTDPDGNTSAFSHPRRNPYSQPTPRPTATPTPTPTTTPPPSSGSTLTVVSQTGKPGDIVSLLISIRQAMSVSAYQFNIQYDPQILTYQSTTKENTLSQDFLIVDGNVIEPGTARIAAAGFNASPFSGDGTLVSVLFEINENATDGETAVTLSNLRDDIEWASTVNGTVTISTFILGDVNEDGIVTAGDAQLAFDFAIGRQIPTNMQLKAGDIDESGEITAGDAQEIFNISIGRSGKIHSRNLTSILKASVSAISVDTVSGMPGEEVQIPIYVQNATELLSYTFDMIFDSDVLEYVRINKQNTLSQDFLLVEGNVVSSGQVRVGGAAFSASSISGSGVLINIVYKIKLSASSSSTIKIESLRDDIAGAAITNGIVNLGSTATPTPTPTMTPTLVVFTPTAVPTMVKHVFIYDNSGDTSNDLTGTTDFDHVDNRNLTIAWDADQNGATDWHIYVRKGFGGMKYLGHSASGVSTSFDWYSGAANLSDEYANGPDFNSAYTFRVVRIDDQRNSDDYYDMAMPVGFNLEGGNEVSLAQPELPNLNPGQVAIYDDILGGNDLAPMRSTGLDIDQQSSRAIQIAWNFGRPTLEVNEYHILVSVDSANPTFLGQTYTSGLNYFWWTPNRLFRTHPDFADGPQDGHTYQFTVVLSPLSGERTSLRSGTLEYSVVE